MSLPHLIVNDVVVPHLAGVSALTQNYRPVAAAARHRMGDGSLFQQTHWRKQATSIQGSGWIPAGLESVDWDSSVTIACIAPRAVQAAGNVITLPAARRLDHAPWGFAIVGNRLVETPLSLVGNVATLTAVAGASGYRANYYPLLTCYASPPEEQLDLSGAIYGWTLEAEEI